jgi:signal transduction histidine kinase
VDGLGSSAFDILPPAVLVLLNAAVAAHIARARSLGTSRAAALILALAPVVYGAGAILQVLLADRAAAPGAGRYWTPGAAIAAIGPLAIPLAASLPLLRTPRARLALLVLVGGGWLCAWVPRLAPAATEIGILSWVSRLEPGLAARAAQAQASEVGLAACLAAAVAIGAYALVRRDESASGRERRAFAVVLFFVAAAVAYLLLKPAGTRMPIYSTVVLCGGQIALLILVARPDVEPSSSKRLAIQALLLAVGALLGLVLAGNLGIFPRSTGPVLVAAAVATAVAVAFALLRSRLDLLLERALYPEAAHAAERVRALEAELEAARRRLAEAERLEILGQLASEVAHEVKNPLGPIRGYARIIEREVEAAGAMNDRIRRGIEIIRDEVAAIDARVRRLLEAAQPARPDLAPLDVAEAVSSVIELVEAARPPAVTIGWVNPPERRVARADAALFRSAVLNVLKNALEALDARPSGRISLTLGGGGEVIELAIEDDGPGLPEDPESLFRTQPAPRAGGRGLGLAIARGALRAQGGDLELARRAGGGTRAVLRIPENADAPPEPEAARRAEAAT